MLLQERIKRRANFHNRQSLTLYCDPGSWGWFINSELVLELDEQGGFAPSDVGQRSNGGKSPAGDA